MPQRRGDASSRKFFDTFEKVRVSRLRATGVIDPAERQALIPFPDGKTRLIATKHSWFPSGGGFSYFCCPGCGRRAANLWLVADAPRCSKCCDAMNIKHRTRMGFGRDERRRAGDQALDRLIAKVETNEPLRFKPAPATWGGRCRTVYNSRNLSNSMCRRLVELRLNQLASRQASSLAKDGDTLRTYQPTAEARQLIDTKPIWRASSTEQLQEALDAAQVKILAALNSDDLQARLAAAKLLLRTRQARGRGL